MSKTNINGAYLNRLWGVGASHALYIHDGHWYHPLKRFPGALFDDHGYLLFATEQDFHDFLTSIRQHIGKDFAIRPPGISALPGYVRALPTVNLAKQQIVFSASVERSLRDPPTERRERLKGASKLATKVSVVTEVFLRNPDVVAEVLFRAQGKCDYCHRPAPFLRKKNGSPYLEVHHKKQLANGGEDTVENAIALCPNCHRELHFGIPNA
jgi:hypothetical protein